MTAKKKERAPDYNELPERAEDPGFSLRPGKYLGSFAHSSSVGGDLGDYHHDNAAGRMYFFTENGWKFVGVS